MKLERRAVILGAAGRDGGRVHGDHQIPGIGGRCYPAALAGPRYPSGIPIVDEATLEALCRRERYETPTDLDAAGCRVEEREEYEPHLVVGNVVFVGVVDAEVVVAATPVDLARLIHTRKGVVRARYEFAEASGSVLGALRGSLRR